MFLWGKKYTHPQKAIQQKGEEAPWGRWCKLNSCKWAPCEQVNSSVVVTSFQSVQVSWSFLSGSGCHLDDVTFKTRRPFHTFQIETSKIQCTCTRTDTHTDTHWHTHTHTFLGFTHTLGILFCASVCDHTHTHTQRRLSVQTHRLVRGSPSSTLVSKSTE